MHPSPNHLQDMTTGELEDYRDELYWLAAEASTEAGAATYENRRQLVIRELADRDRDPSR